MSNILLIGSEIAADVRVDSQTNPYAVYTVTTLQDLVDRLRKDRPARFAMLQTTAGKVSDFLQKPCDQISIATLAEKLGEFRQDLKERRYPPATIGSYSHFANSLITHAKRLGWVGCKPALSEEWQELKQAAGRSAHGILMFFAGQGKSPSAITEEDLYGWTQMRVQRGRSFVGSKNSENSFRKALLNAGYTDNLDGRKMLKPEYGTRLESFPAPIRREVEEVLRWKQADYAPTRSRKRQIRAVTAKGLINMFCGLYGFATKTDRRAGITTMRDLITQEIVTKYAEFRLNERKVAASSVLRDLLHFSGAMRGNPSYKDVDFTWITELIQSLPAEDDDALRLRKAEKYLPYSVLAAIPEKIRADRLRVDVRKSKERAMMARDELLVQWLVILPWRQSNIRELRIGGPTPNLFKEKIQANSPVKKPRWVKEAEKLNPNTEFWQFRFSKKETKTKNSIHCILPFELVAPLEEYLCEHRKELVGDSDPRTLFLNAKGTSMLSIQVRYAVSELTLRYGGRVVTPHLFRDIFAYMWLERCPEDYLTVSKLLWHRNIQMTIDRYGARFNESSALCRMEDAIAIDNAPTPLAKDQQSMEKLRAAERRIVELQKELSEALASLRGH